MVSTRRSRSSRADAVKELLIEVTLLHHHVVAATRGLADPGDLTNGQVSLLRSVARDGPRTVPELASERAIARQPVQRMVAELEDLGLVQLVENPRHKRSRLVALTAAGRRSLSRMERRQSSWTRGLGERVSEARIRGAAAVLRRLREQIVSRAPIPGRNP